MFCEGTTDGTFGVEFLLSESFDSRSANFGACIEGHRGQ
jgi:hypothetical protein